MIKYHQIYLFSISLKEELFAISYDDILKMVAYPAAIELRLRAKEVDYQVKDNLLVLHPRVDSLL